MNSYWNGKRVLVTGGAGFMGSHLVDSLLAEGSEVVVLDNLERGKAENLKHCMEDIEFLQSDLRKDFPKNIDSDIVFHLAAKVYGVRHLYRKPATMLQDNMQILINTLKHTKDAEKHIFISSSCVYDWEGVPLPHKEEDLGLLTSFYGWSKLFGELLCKAYNEEVGSSYVAVRPFNVYGPRESLKSPHVIPDFIQKSFACKQGEDTFEIIGDGTQTRAFTYIDDTVEGILKVAEHGRNREAYNLSSSRETKIMELAETIWDIFDIDPELKFVPKDPREVYKRVGSSAKASAELGWKAETNLKQGLEQTVDWFETIGYFQ